MRSLLPSLEDAVYVVGLKLARFKDSNSLFTRIDSDDLKDLIRAVVQQEDKGHYLLQEQGEEDVRADCVVLEKVVRTACHQ